MNSSHIAILYKVSELARRYGLRPSEADAEFALTQRDPEDDLVSCRLSFHSSPNDPEKVQKYRQMTAALGCEGNSLVTEDLHEMEDIIEQAISLAPRARSR